MKKQELNNELVIIYDADCPMCCWYTGKFVEHDLLPQNGREAYQNIGPFTQTKIDMNKAKNHLALLNKQTGEVIYGFRSLAAILGARWSWIKNIATVKMFVPLFAGLYDFISYNRKIIAPAPQRGYLDCIPEKNLLWRSVFMLICMLLVEFTAGMYFSVWFDDKTNYNALPWRESVLFAAQIIFQALMAIIFSEKQLYDYLAHVAVVSAFGGLLLIPLHFTLLLLQHFGFHVDFLASAGLGAVLMAMFMEHKRRIKLLGYKSVLSYTWVLFRVLLFFVIFKN